MARARTASWTCGSSAIRFRTSSESRSPVFTMKSISAIWTSGDICVCTASTAARRTTSRSAKRSSASRLASRTFTLGSFASASSSAWTMSLRGASIWPLQLTPFSRSVADCCCISESVTMCRRSWSSWRMTSISDDGDGGPAV